MVEVGTVLPSKVKGPGFHSYVTHLFAKSGARRHLLWAEARSPLSRANFAGLEMVAEPSGPKLPTEASSSSKPKLTSKPAGPELKLAKP